MKITNEYLNSFKAIYKKVYGMLKKNLYTKERFITKELVMLLKRIRKYRQIILVTHNANIVVNSDSDQVIVANNVEGKISYISGSLENPKINGKICEILEGGKTAFKKRRNKYSEID